jgi:hypothetical protein
VIENVRACSRVLLALIRLVNGVIGLFAPHLIIRRFNENDEDPPVARYALRMFGIRTILVALDLLRRPGPDRTHAVRMAPIIHASDAVTAALAGRSGLVPRRTATLIVAISGFNTLLALAMQGGHDDAG